MLFQFRQSKNPNQDIDVKSDAIKKNLISEILGCLAETEEAPKQNILSCCGFLISYITLTSEFTRAAVTKYERQNDLTGSYC